MNLSSEQIEAAELLSEETPLAGTAEQLNLDRKILEEWLLDPEFFSFVIDLARGHRPSPGNSPDLLEEEAIEHLRFLIKNIPDPDLQRKAAKDILDYLNQKE